MKARGLIAVAFALAGGLGASIFFVQRHAQSADHLDSPAVTTDPTVDIDDVYTWMDGSNAVFVMTSYPTASSTTLFSTSVQYVFHTSSGAAYGQTNVPYDIICTFAGTTAPQTTTCWGGTNEYVTGNASVTTGITSADGKFKVFAGPRADPFFFNIDGFHAVIADVKAAVAGNALTFNDAGCPTNAPAAALAAQLSHAADGGAPADFFSTLTGLAIVISIDKSIVASTAKPIVSVWGGTYK